MGVVSAIIRFMGANLTLTEWAESNGAQVLAVVMYAAIIAYFIWDSLRAKPEEE